MRFWNGKPIESLESSHIERILAAVKRGAWADGKPCRVDQETAIAMRLELRTRSEDEFVPEAPEDLSVTFGEPVAPPDYSNQLAAMGYVPPPPPIAVPAPWSPPVRTKLPTFPSVTAEPMESKGQRRIEELELLVSDLKLELRNAERRTERLREAAERLKVQRDMALKADRREEQGEAKRLLLMRRRAEGADLMDIEEADLLAWWTEELRGCGGALVEGLERVIRAAYRGMSVRDIKPRKLRRPGIQEDKR